MATFKNNKPYPVDVPGLDLHIAEGATFEIPDDMASSFAADPDFGESKAKNPDVVPTVEAVDSFAAPVPVATPVDAGAPSTDPASA